MVNVEFKLITFMIRPTRAADRHRRGVERRAAALRFRCCCRTSPRLLSRIPLGRVTTRGRDLRAGPALVHTIQQVVQVLDALSCTASLASCAWALTSPAAEAPSSLTALTASAAVDFTDFNACCAGSCRCPAASFTVEVN